MGVKKSVAALAEIVDKMKFHPPEMIGLVQTNKCLEKEYILGGPLPTSEELDTIAERVCKQVHSGKCGQVKSKDWKKIPWCLWLRPYMLAHDQAVLEAYLRWLRSEGRWGQNNLVVEYLRNFDLKDESIHQVGGELAPVVAGFDTPWLGRHRIFSLFTPHRAPGHIAVLALGSGSEVHSFLEEVGLIRDDLLYHGLGAESLRAALEIHAGRGRSKEEFDRHFDCISNWVFREGEFKFKTLRAEIATKLLIPWAHDYPREWDEFLSRTCEFLLRHYLDPRLHPTLWNGVEKDARAVIMRWLA